MREINLMLMETIFNLLDGMENEDVTAGVVEYEIDQLHNVRNLVVSTVDFDVKGRCSISFNYFGIEKLLVFDTK